MADLTLRPLGFPWPTRDPFLFCVHHLDHYPAGHGDMSISPEHLKGRRLGMDFELKDGFRMYHGERVPGFPAHPHRGFETVTLARQGHIDHSDSLGARARFGDGDVQWMTAGRGIVHCEMFPLLKSDAPNPAELFQIWLNLPAKNKMVAPHFSMLWRDGVPVVKKGGSEITVIAGALGEARAPAPPPNSWAADASADVAIWTVALAPGAKVEVPAAREGTLRTLYFFEGRSVNVGGTDVSSHQALEMADARGFTVTAGPTATELLMLQGRPIGEPVAQHGPFVMNTREELVAAYEDYQHTQFGGWPWRGPDPVHDRDQARFALHPDGRSETPG